MGTHTMANTKVKISRWSTGVVILSLALFFFTVPHSLEDFAAGELLNSSLPATVISYGVASLFALQALALFWTGRRLRRSYVIHFTLGLFWPFVVGITQLPEILSGSLYRTGSISIYYVIGTIVIGVLLSLFSVLALRASRPD